MIRRRAVRPTSYVTRIPDTRTWQEILAKYRAGQPTLGATTPVKPRKVTK